MPLPFFRPDAKPRDLAEHCAAEHCARIVHDLACLCVSLLVAGCGGEATSPTSPDGRVVVPPRAKVVQVSAGYAHRCFRFEDGTAACMGDNDHGQLGDGTFVSSARAVSIEGLTDVAEIATAETHTCARTSSGEVHCFGDNTYGQIGDGTFQDRAEPRPVEGLSGVTALALGRHFSCALLESGSVSCWGRNMFGQLGDGESTRDRPRPRPVAGVEQAIQIAAGAFHACAILSDGTVRCWGNNEAGQHGDGQRGQAANPSASSALISGVESIAAGGGPWCSSLEMFDAGHTCAINQADALYCWGEGSMGQISQATAPTGEPRAIDLGDVAQVVAGSRHTCARLNDGRVFCFGDNVHGQIGSPGLPYSSTPTEISGVSGVIGITAEGCQTCTWDAAGTVICWGHMGSRTLRMPVEATP